MLAAPPSLAIDTIALLNDPALALTFTTKEHLVSSFLPRYSVRQGRAYPVDCGDLRLLHLLTEANRDPRTLTEKFKLDDVQHAFSASISRFEQTVDSKSLPDGLWLRIFVELGRYLSTVKESRKDFLGHFEVCLQMAAELRDEAVLRECRRELDRLLSHLHPDEPMAS